MLLAFEAILPRMNISVEELQDKGYVLQDEVPYKDLKGYITTYLSKTNAATIFFFCINMLFFAALAVKLVLVAKGKVNGHIYTSYFTYGIVLMGALVPVHEVIHAIAYKLCGAKKVSFDIRLRQMIFLTVADKFVANKSEFMKTLLAPFIIISLLLIVLSLTTNTYLQCTCITALVMHTLGCAGDFSLASYFLFHKDKEILTYDDAKAEIVYFYKKDGV